MQQYVEGFRYAWYWHVLALHDAFVRFRTTQYVVGLHRKDFLKDVGCTECFECPNLHFSETLTSELRLTTKRLLSDE